MAKIRKKRDVISALYAISNSLIFLSFIIFFLVVVLMISKFGSFYGVQPEDTSQKKEAEKIKKFLNNLELSSINPKVKQKIQDFFSRLKKEKESFHHDTVDTITNILLRMPLEEKKFEGDTTKMRELFEKTHIGLEIVKENIISFLQLQKKRKKRDGKVLCFVGEPGVGKTSFAQSLATILEVDLIRIPLGNVNDPNVLSGCASSYVNSCPGILVTEFTKAKYTNPVILLDEIDKMKTSHQGDPYTVLMQILDPEQNNDFKDNYCGSKSVSFDLSKVLFVWTANDEKNIPVALKDRMEVIRIPDYSPEEKFRILKEKAMAAENEQFELKKKIKFSDEVLHEIVRRVGGIGLRQPIRVLKDLMKKIIVDYEGKFSSENNDDCTTIEEVEDITWVTYGHTFFAKHKLWPELITRETRNNRNANNGVNINGYDRRWGPWWLVRLSFAG